MSSTETTTTRPTTSEETIPEETPQRRYLKTMYMQEAARIIAKLSGHHDPRDVPRDAAHARVLFIIAKKKLLDEYNNTTDQEQRLEAVQKNHLLMRAMQTFEQDYDIYQKMMREGRKRDNINLLTLGASMGSLGTGALALILRIILDRRKREKHKKQKSKRYR